jgi:hypothetical protein
MMLGLGAQLALLLSAGAASLRVEPNAPCVTQAGLTLHLEAAGVRLRDGAEPRILARARGAELELRVVYATKQVLERRIPVGADCAAVERIAATLIAAWIDSPPRLPPGHAASQSPQTESRAVEAHDPGAPVRTQVDPLTTLEPVRTNDRPGRAETQQPEPRHEPTASGGSDEPSQREPLSESSRAEDRTQPSSATSESEVTPPASVTRPSHVSSESEPTPPADLIEPTSEPTAAMDRPKPSQTAAASGPIPPGADRQWSLLVGLLGGLMVGQTPRAVGGGTLLVELGRHPFGLGLEAGLEGARSEAIEPGRLWASHQWLGLYGRGRVELGRVALQAALGIRGWRVGAGSVGFPEAREVVLFGAGPMVGLGASLHLTGPLSLRLQTTGALRLPEERLRIEPSRKGVTLRIWEIGALAGLTAEVP